MFWHNPMARGTALLTQALIALTFAAFLSVSGGAAPAYAAQENFCNGMVSAGTPCTGPSRALTGVRGTNNGSGAGCAGAWGYGEYYCATPSGCHTYNGVPVLTPAIRHRASTSRSMIGLSTWGSTSAPASCVQGTTYRRMASGTVVTAEPDGVPVIEDRPAEQAPAEVAEIWPSGDDAAARRFDTPNGDGWVVLVSETRQVCVAVPDPVDGYGYSCQSYVGARKSGALMTLEDANTDSAKSDLAIAIVPDGGRASRSSAATAPRSRFRLTTASSWSSSRPPTRPSRSMHPRRAPRRSSASDVADALQLIGLPSPVVLCAAGDGSFSRGRGGFRRAPARACA